MLAERFAGAGWECEALVAAARVADDFYFDAFAQVHMGSWSSGRVALVGDAGYCASPLSGLGTSLALVGAYVLAGELGPARPVSTEHLRCALDRYERRLRPYVATSQLLPGPGIEGYAPKSKANIAMTARGMQLMQRWPFRPIAARLWFTKADAIDLPDYPAGSVVDVGNGDQRAL
jgi:2-polyprenyl-6-methoxyphenol hydroxylase-like FAD-dependent oxidoreductase